MIRVVVSVTVATALLAVSLPAVDSARGDRTAAHLDGELARLSDAAASLVDRDDATRSGVPGARRVVTLSVPTRSWSTAGVDAVRVGCRGGQHGDVECQRPTLEYELETGRQQRVRLDLPLVVVDGPLVFRDAGNHRLTLTLDRHNGSVAVVVEREQTPSSR